MIHTQVLNSRWKNLVNDDEHLTLIDEAGEATKISPLVETDDDHLGRRLPEICPHYLLAETDDDHQGRRLPEICPHNLAGTLSAVTRA